MTTRRYNFVAYVSNEFSAVVSFSYHKSRTTAQKRYGDLSKYYRGTARSDYDLEIATWDEFLKMEDNKEIHVDWEKKTFRFGGGK